MHLESNGSDLTSPHLHLGHTVNLWMMRQPSKAIQERFHFVKGINWGTRSL